MLNSNPKFGDFNLRGIVTSNNNNKVFLRMIPSEKDKRISIHVGSVAMLLLMLIVLL